MDTQKLAAALGQANGQIPEAPPEWPGLKFDQWQIRINGCPDPDFIAQQIQTAGDTGWEFKAFLPLTFAGPPALGALGLVTTGPPQQLMVLQFQRCRLQPVEAK